MDDKTLFRLIMKIAAMPYQLGFATIDAPGKFTDLIDRRDNVVKPDHDQTKSGLFLKIYYNTPECIHTPWGKYVCWGSGWAWEPEKLQSFISQLGGVLHLGKRIHGTNHLGSVYGITRVGDIKLPLAVYRSKEDYISFDDARAQWHRMVVEYGEQ
jgi:hypothetical protein